MNKKKILIIDDESDLVKIIEYSLIRAGYKVYIASNGEEGLKKMEKNKPDLILLDLILPGRNGFQIAREIKSMNKYKDIPIIVLSCKRDNINKYAALKNGAVEYIEKPANLDRLIFHCKDILTA